MDDEEAKRILALYRPGTDDPNDPDFKEALARANAFPAATGRADKADSELGCWFQEHCSSYLSIRARFLEIEPPPGLKEQILAEGKPPASKVFPFRTMVLLRAAAVFVLCLGLTALFWRSHSGEDDFNIYRSRMVRTAMQPYGMELQSHGLPAINAFLAGRKAPVDYALPEGVPKAQAVGCAVLKWHGQPVSMICFHTGQSSAPGGQTDLWLFIVDQSSVRNGPTAFSPTVARVNKLMTAAWSRDGKMYVLAAAGDEDFLRKFF
jgi:hypothetical protein